MASSIESNQNILNIEEPIIFKQNICRFNVPKERSAKIEAFVQSKNLDLPDVDWGHVAGRPVFYITTAKRLTNEELDNLQIAINNKGIETFGSRHSPMEAAYSIISNGESITFKQNICRFHVPEEGSAKIEAFVQSKNLDLSNVDWGYVAGNPVFYITTAKRLTNEELDNLEIAIRNKGIKTFGGG